MASLVFRSRLPAANRGAVAILGLALISRPKNRSARFVADPKRVLPQKIATVMLS
jgi:hypothetical protein